MILKVILFFALNNQSDTIVQPRMYYDCIVRGLESHYYYMREDFLLLRSAQAEQWRGRVQEVGKWNCSDSLVTFSRYDSLDKRTYRIKKIESLNYLIPDTSNFEKTSNFIKDCILKKRHEELGERVFNSELTQSIEFEFARACICELGVLVEVSHHWLFFEERKLEFESYKRIEKRKKRNR